MLRSAAAGRLCRLLSTTAPCCQQQAPAAAADSSTAAEQLYDVVICGAGMVGLAAAAALRTHPMLRDLRISVLEAGRPPTSAPLPAEFGNRVCALSPATRRLLEQIGAWHRMQRYNTVLHMQVWDACSDAVIRFGDDRQPEELAYIVENDVISGALRVALAEAGAQVRYDTRVEEIRLPVPDAAPPDDAVCLRLADGIRIRCSLLIGADGAGSAVRTAMAVRTAARSYQQRGVVATLKLAAECDVANTVAWQRFLPSGPLALLPLSPDRSSLVWSTSDQQAARLLALSDEHFTDALNQVLWEQRPPAPGLRWATDCTRSLLQAVGVRSPSGPVQLPPAVCGVVAGSRAAFPLSLQQVGCYTRRRALLVGDAARRIHPLAGQGANLGFGDVTELTGRLAAAVAAGRDLGTTSTLAGYQTARQRASAAMLTLTDGLQRLYGTEAAPVVLLRSVGLQICDALPMARHFLTDRARA